MQPAEYEAWYHTPRGAWIAELEFSLLIRLLRPSPGQSLLDAGCGTGYFSRRFSWLGLEVTGIDADPAMLAYARGRGDAADYVRGDILRLPFAAGAFDYAAAVTSLCFVEPPGRAAEELWRVSRRGMVLGLLNRHSLLYRKKHGRGGYRGARWDTIKQAQSWWKRFAPDASATAQSALWFPGAGRLSRCLEPLMPRHPVWGGFLAIVVRKPQTTDRTTDSS